MSAVETPSGKGAGDENFPVASRLIAPRLRGHVMAFYAFARAADDIADSPALEPDDKVARLDRLGGALTDTGADDPALAVAHRLRASLAETGVEPHHPLDLLAAFKQDATKRRYADWADAVGVDYGPLDEDTKQEKIYELDAVVAHLYGLSRDHVEVIFETFHDGWDYEERLERVLDYYSDWADRLDLDHTDREAERAAGTRGDD